MSDRQNGSGFYVLGDGTLAPDADSYVQREADDELLDATRAGALCYVLATRQMGKSSLMVRTAYRLAAEGVRSAQISLETIRETDGGADQFFYSVAYSIRRGLGIVFDLDAWWKDRANASSTERFYEFLTELLIEKSSEPMVVFIDEIDSMIGLRFADDFFATIRACHNARASQPVLERLTFVLLGVATPVQLVADPARTPFNVGRGIQLSEFSFEQAWPLTRGFSGTESYRRALLTRTLEWTGGHPYLTYALCRAIASSRGLSVPDSESGVAEATTVVDEEVERLFLLSGADKNDGHLNMVRRRLTEGHGHVRQALLTYRRVWAGRKIEHVPTSPVQTTLKLAGVVRPATDGRLVVSNRIYATVFDDAWIRGEIPRDWRWPAAAVVLLAAAGLSFYLGQRVRENELQPSQAQSGVISAGESREYRVRLRAGQAARVLLDQHRPDLALSVTAPGSQTAQVVDVSGRGLESATVIATATGDAIVRVRAVSSGSPVPYAIRLDAFPRETTESDRRRTKAESIATEAKAASSKLPPTESAIALWKEALGLWLATGDDREQSVALAGLGEIFYRRADYARAEQAYAESLTKARGVGDQIQVTQNLNALGNVKIRRGALVESKRDFEEAARVVSPIPSAQDLFAVVLMNLGTVLVQSGEHRGALAQLTASLAIVERLNQPYLRGQVLNGMGWAHYALGQSDAAVARLTEAGRSLRDAGSRMAELFVLIRLGQVQFESGEIGAAQATATDVSIRFADFGPADVTQADLADLRGKIAAAVGKYREALADHQMALSRYTTLRNSSGMAEALEHIGAAYRGLRMWPEGKASLQRALAIRRELGLRGPEARTLYELGLLEWKMGDLPAARESLRSAIAINDDVRGRAAALETERSYMRARRNFSSAYIDVLMESHRLNRHPANAAEAFLVAEQAGGMLFADVFRQLGNGILSGVDASLLAREREQRQQLDSLTFTLSQLARLPAGERERADIKDALSRTLLGYRETLDRIRSASPDLSRFLSPRALTLRELQSRVVTPRGSLLRFVLGAQQSYAWLVTRDTIKVAFLPPVADITLAARRLTDLLAEREPPRQAGGQSGDRYAREMAALSSMLLGPFANELRSDTDHLLIVPDGVLQGVPFAALPAPGTSEPLVARYEITMSPTASAVAALEERRANRRRPSRAVAVVADPVYEVEDPRIVRREGPGTKTTTEPQNPPRLEMGRLMLSRFEAEAILAQVPSTEQSFAAFGLNASRPGLLGIDFGDYQVIHFATHVIFDGALPEQSGIMLSSFDANGRTQDSVLNLVDIQGLQLRADLVVLSACETALGDPEVDGRLGVTRAMLNAGASSVLSSLAVVQEEPTLELMKAFYASLLRSRRSAAAALRDAQLRMRAHPRYSDPRYWSSWVLIGDPR